MNLTMSPEPGVASRTASAETRIPGAVLALASAATAVLSVVLLFGYVTGLSDRTDELVLSAQALFANQGTMDYAEALLSASGEAAIPELPPVLTGGLVSSISAVPDTESDSRSFEILLPGAEDLRVVRCRGGALIAGSTSQGLILTFHRTGSDRSEPGFPILLGSVPSTAGWAISGCESADSILGVVASSQDGAGQLSVIGEGGAVRSLALDDLQVSSSTVMTTGWLHGSAAVALSDGSNHAVLVDLNGAASERFDSPDGTCPVFLPWGEFYGEPGTDLFTGSAGYTVADFFTGDFNQDGEPDVAWVGPSSVACLLSGRDLVSLDSVEGSSLVAWGFLEGRYGLGGLWESPDGRLSWRKLLWSGFQQLPAGGIALSGYTGRISSTGGTVTGVRSGKLEYATAGVSSAPVLTIDGGTPIDLDASGVMDAAVIRDGSVTLMPDPCGPIGTSLRLTVTTVSPSGEWLFTGSRAVPSGGRIPGADA
jgi:hypothetical protein